MRSIRNDDLATITFRLEWEKDAIRHADILHAPRVNFWRDLLREPIGEKLSGRRAGDAVTATFAPGHVTGARSAGKVYRVPRKRVVGRLNSGEKIIPRYGRFYPAGVLQDLPGLFRGSVIPFRCVGLDGDAITADFNHPLAEVPLTITAVPEIDFTEVAGLGLNAEELSANRRLSQRVVHDLNADPRLPFDTGRFDAAVCSVSVEYLTDPLAVFDEVARVLRPGGRVRGDLFQPVVCPQGDPDLVRAARIRAPGTGAGVLSARQGLQGPAHLFPPGAAPSGNRQVLRAEPRVRPGVCRVGEESLKLETGNLKLGKRGGATGQP